MVTMSPEILTLIIFGGALIGILLGYPLGFGLSGVAMWIGFLVMGDRVFNLFSLRILSFLSDYNILSVPLFIFMGIVVEKSGAAERLYKGLYIWFAGFRGGLAIATIIMGTVLAATVGVIAASVVMLSLIAIPSMLQRGYNKELVSGAVCAGGSLGILIPPSVMLVFYAAMAQLSVGRLFMAAFIPGFILSGMYMVYIAIRCWLNPELAPTVSAEERTVPLSKKLYLLVTGVLPVAFLILAVLGTMFLGIAAPTEAAAIGAVASVILALAYRNFNLQSLKATMLETLRVTSMVYLVALGSTTFTGVFLRLGGGGVVGDMILATPGGSWGAFLIIMFIIFILGMFIDWIGITFIIIPVIAPLVPKLGFDPIWFAMMACVNLQTSFMTPPFAAAIFYLKGIAKPEWGLTSAHIIRGVIPFIIIIIITLGLLAVFPQLITWLPEQMVK